MHDGEGKSDPEEQHRGDVFAQQQLQLAQGLGQYHLELATPDVLRQRSHGDRRHEEEEEPGEHIQHRPEAGHLSEIGLTEEEKSIDRKEDDQQHVSSGQVEQGFQLAPGHGPDAHQTASC